MPDEVGTETTRSDAPSADQSLFGDAVDDAAAAVAEEQGASEETEQDPQGSDYAGEPSREAGPPSAYNSPRRTGTSSRSMTWTYPGWHRRSRR